MFLPKGQRALCKRHSAVPVGIITRRSNNSGGLAQRDDRRDDAAHDPPTGRARREGDESPLTAPRR